MLNIYCHIFLLNKASDISFSLIIEYKYVHIIKKIEVFIYCR